MIDAVERPLQGLSAGKWRPNGRRGRYFNDGSWRRWWSNHRCRARLLVNHRGRQYGHFALNNEVGDHRQHRHCRE
jgi:hypothetical protein